MKYAIRVTRAEYRAHVFQVEAEELGAAFRAAIKESEGYDFSEGDLVACEERTASVAFTQDPVPARSYTASTKKGDS